MTATTDNLSLRYLVPGDAPDISGGLKMLGDDVADRIMRRDNTSTGVFVGQRSLVNGIEYRWDGTKWNPFTWTTVARTTWASFANDGYADTRGETELSVVGGLTAVTFSTTRDAGVAVDQTMLRLAAGFRPSGTRYFGGRAVDASGNRTTAGFRIESDGTIYLDSTTGTNLRSLGAAIPPFRAAS